MSISESERDIRDDYFARRRQNPGGTWPAKRELAAALRELIHELCPTGASEEEIRQATEWAKQSALRFKETAEGDEVSAVNDPVGLSGMHDFLERGPLMGLSNPISPGLETDPDWENKIARGTVTFGNAYEGAPGVVHGGFVAAVLDEMLGMVSAMSGAMAMTGEIKIRYRKPTPVNTPLRIEARLERQSGRRVFTAAELYAGEIRTAESEGLFIIVGDAKFVELEREYTARK